MSSRSMVAIVRVNVAQVDGGDRAQGSSVLEGVLGCDVSPHGELGLGHSAEDIRARPGFRPREAPSLHCFA